MVNFTCQFDWVKKYLKHFLMNICEDVSREHWPRVGWGGGLLHVVVCHSTGELESGYSQLSAWVPLLYLWSTDIWVPTCWEPFLPAHLHHGGLLFQIYPYAASCQYLLQRRNWYGSIMHGSSVVTGTMAILSCHFRDSIHGNWMNPDEILPNTWWGIAKEL